MARDKVLYEGHAVAAVAATTPGDRRRGARADRREVRGAAARDRRRGGDGATDAPVLHDDLFTAGVEPKPDEAVEHRQAGDASPRATSRPASREADVIVEGRYTTQPVHQAYIEPHACVASVGADGQAHDLQLEPGPVHGARLLRQAAGHATSPTSAPSRRRSAAASAARRWSIWSRWRSRCRKKSGRPVKMVMTREEVFRASGPTSGAVDRGEDRRQEGRHDRRRAARC